MANEKEIKKELADIFPHTSFLYDNLSDGVKGAQKSLRFRGDFINKYKDRLPGLKEAQDIMLRSSKLARSIKKKVDNIAVLERVLQPDRRRMVNKFIEVGTSRQIWPSELRPTTNEQGKEVQRRKVTVDEGFRKLFESKLNEMEQAIVMEVFEHGEDVAWNPHGT